MRNHNFINFDDNIYVTKNEHVLSGISPENITWAFSFSGKEKPYWHPLAWISHMADVELLGVDAGRHHLSSLFLHTVNSILLFVLLNLMTGAPWKSGFVAALFALHPLNVDTVAWIAERKNLISTFFWFVVMLAYFHYTNRPSFMRYLLVVVSFVLGLLAKPMLVTLPFVLLLMDYWPLGRQLRNRHHLAENSTESHSPTTHCGVGILGLRVILDKLPLIFLSFLSVYVSTFSLAQSGNIISTERIPMGLRISNALVSYIAYLGKTVFPHNMAVYYPFPHSIPFWQSAGALFLLTAISILVIAAWRSRPYLLTGWFWYTGTLVPVSGLYQAGVWPAMADRWAYIPLIGIFIILVWGIPDLLDKWSLKKTALPVFAGIVISILVACSWLQVRHWKNSDTLFEHALNVTKDNDLAHYYFAATLMDWGDLDGAVEHCTKAIAINPDDIKAYHLLGQIYKRKGEISKALFFYYKALRIDQNYTDIYNSIGVALMHRGEFTHASQMFSKVISAEPKHEPAHVNLGICLASQGKTDQAILIFTDVLKMNPKLSEVHYHLANALLTQSKLNMAVVHYGKVSRYDPNYLNAQQKLKELINK